MALFGRRRQRPGNAARSALPASAFGPPVDCTPWVLGDLWPAELATVTPQTASLADYLHSDLQRIAESANRKLQAIKAAGLAGAARTTAEARVVNVARAFAVLRVESTVRQLCAEQMPPDIELLDLNPAPSGTAPDPGPPAEPAEAARQAADAQLAESAPEPPVPTESGDQRLRRLLEYVARQEPRLRWAVGIRQDGSTVLTTDLAHGWIPPGVRVPAGIRLLEPSRRHGDAAALLDGPTLLATYAPGDRLGGVSESGDSDSVADPRELPVIDELGWTLADATHRRDGLPRMVDTMAKASAAGTGVAEAEVDLLRVHLDTARYRLLAQYPDVDGALLLDCLLMAATAAIAIGDRLSANYHLSWFQALAGQPAGRMAHHR